MTAIGPRPKPTRSSCCVAGRFQPRRAGSTTPPALRSHDSIRYKSVPFMPPLVRRPPARRDPANSLRRSSPAIGVAAAPLLAHLQSSGLRQEFNDREAL